MTLLSPEALTEPFERALQRNIYAQGYKASEQAKSQETTLFDTIEGAKPRHVHVSRLLRKYYRHFPAVHLDWAKKLFAWQRKEEAFTFTAMALANAHHHTHPADIFFHGISLLKGYDFIDHASALSGIAIRAFPGNQNLELLNIKLLRMQNRTTEATSRAEAARAVFPKDTRFSKELGHAYLRQKRSEDAVEAFSTLVPNERNNSISLAYAYRKNGQFKEAIDTLTPYLAAHPKDTQLRNIIADTLKKDGRPQEAIDFLDKEIELNPFISLKARRAEILLYQEKFDEVIAYLEPWIRTELRPDTVITLTSAYKAAYRYEDALNFAEEAYQAKPTDARIIKNLALVCVDLCLEDRFNQLKPYLTPDDALYSEAKLTFFKGDIAKSQVLLEPHMQDLTKTTRRIVGIFLAGAPDNHPIYSRLSDLGDGAPTKLVEYRDSWRTNPLRKAPKLA